MAGDDPSPEELRDQQAAREHAEREHAADADTGAEERAATRRAEKSGYLKEKLEEQAAADDDE